MNHNEAAEIIKDAGMYMSADFYRMLFSDTIALGLQDPPVNILMDVVNHGSDAAKGMLESAVRYCLVEKTEPQQGVTIYDIVDDGKGTAGYYFNSHIAMQIAYPDRYAAYFSGEHIWEADHPKMRELLDLCVSCLTNKQHPSDYYGEHEISTGKKPPKVVAPKNAVFSTWVAACQQYKKELSESWAGYQDACATRKEAEVAGKAWRDGKLDELRNEMASIAHQYQMGIEPYNLQVEAAKDAHSDLKAQGKPRREDYE